MKRSVKGVLAVLAVLLAIGGAVADDEGSALLWWVYTNDKVVDNGTETTVGALLSRGLSEGENNQHVTTARVRVFNKNGTALDNTWLNLYYQPDPNNDSYWRPTTSPDLYFGNDSSVAPTTSPIGPSWADFAEYGSTEYSFAIELGFLNDDDEWISMAMGRILNYGALEGFRSDGTAEKPEMVPWSTSFVVPEPSSGLLLFVGGALLALKRRKAWQIGR